MLKVSITSAREGLSELVEVAASGDDRVVITKKGKSVCALISMDDLSLLRGAESQSPRERTKEEVKESILWASAAADVMLRLTTAKGRLPSGAEWDREIEREVARRKSRLRRRRSGSSRK